MIVPDTRLLIMAALSLIPLAAIAALYPDMSFFIYNAAGVCVFIAIADALISKDRLLEVNPEMPDIVRLSRDREGEMIFQIKCPESKSFKIRVSFPFPEQILTPFPEADTVLGKEGDSFSMSWKLTGIRQGLFILELCCIETPSVLGLWAIRKRVPIHTELRVYPNLFTGKENLNAIIMKSRSGIHSLRSVGKGRDFEQLREYMSGDALEDIHWKATAKRNQPISKIYQIEKTQQIYAVIDASRLSARNPEKLAGNDNPDEKDATVLERFVTAALILGAAAENQGDNFGLITFNDQVRTFISAKTGKAHYNACRDALYTLTPSPAAPDFSELFTFMGTRIRRRSLLIFLTSLDDPVLSEDFQSGMAVIGKRHLSLVNMMRPFGAKRLFTGDQVESPEDIYRNLGGHMLWKNLFELEKSFKRNGVGLGLLDNERLCAQLVSQYISIKQRQVL